MCNIPLDDITYTYIRYILVSSANPWVVSNLLYFSFEVLACSYKANFWTLKTCRSKNIFSLSIFGLAYSLELAYVFYELRLSRSRGSSAVSICHDKQENTIFWILLNSFWTLFFFKLIKPCHEYIPHWYICKKSTESYSTQNTTQDSITTPWYHIKAVQRHSGSNLLLWTSSASDSDHAALDFGQLGLENLQGWRLRSFSELLLWCLTILWVILTFCRAMSEAILWKLQALYFSITHPPQTAVPRKPSPGKRQKATQPHKRHILSQWFQTLLSWCYAQAFGEHDGP